MPLPKQRRNNVSDAGYRANEIITIVNERKSTTSCGRACCLFTNAGSEGDAVWRWQRKLEVVVEVELNKKKRGREVRRQRRRKLG
ncbi:hypothetical protein N665_0948s0004 [Sinapis alba]|nr:hypothetical protein N665_0948s0004 [Sinapis alba]